MDDVEILTRALKLEQNGERFYEGAVSKTSDPETAKMYQQLADDEKLHADFIGQQLEALQGGNEWVEIPELEEISPIDIETPIFEVNVKVLEKMPEDASEEDALLFALGAEVQTYELYMKGAKAASGNVGKEMYLKLAQVERGHFDLLMMRYESRFPYSH